MIINSISMKNFQCYFGEHEKNTFEFTEGLNLIIGDNGGGKSKLFDAFYWVLYDQIFNSDTRRFLATKSFKENIFSDKAKNECDIGDSIDTEVILQAKSSMDKVYKLTRIYKAKKVGDREWVCSMPSRLLIDEFKVTRWVSIESAKHTAILRLVIPNHLKPYMWFQGEQVDGLMDFTDKSTLTNAINILSNISVYDDLIAISKKGHEKASRNFRAAQNKLIKDEGISKQLNIKRSNLVKKIDEKIISTKKASENVEIAKDEIEKLIGKIEDAESKTALKGEKDRLEKKIVDNNAELTNKYNGFHKKMFTDSWVLKQSQTYFDKYSENYKKYFQLHNSSVSSANAPVVKLPINIPQPIHVTQMLDEEKCFVCDRSAKVGSSEYNFISSLLERGEDVEKKDVFKNDCSTTFSKLYDNGLSFKQLIKNIDSKISSEFSDIQILQNNIKSHKLDIEKIKCSFEELIEDDKSENIVKSFRTHEFNRERFQSLLNADEVMLANFRKEVAEVDASLEKLVEGTIDEFIDRSNNLFSDLFEVTQSTRDEVFRDLIKELEEKANSLFEKMTARNNAITGKIKLRCLSNGKYIPEIVGTDGYILGNPNDSNIVLVKLALIMAIIISRGKWSENFSLISDAPTAKMAEKYTYGFYETLGQNFTQSIITTYDFINDKDRGILKEFNMGSIYIIESHFPNNDSSDRSDLEVIINKVQL